MSSANFAVYSGLDLTANPTHTSIRWCCPFVTKPAPSLPDLYYEDSIWSTLGPGDEAHVDTYSGHRWFLSDKSSTADRTPWRATSGLTAHVNVWCSDVFHELHTDL